MASEFSTLEAIVKVFRPLSYLTDALSGEKCVTASAVWPLLDYMHSKEVKSVMMNDLEIRYTTAMLNILLDKCSYLDPRFRTAYL